jgi:mono/diheme cytochrome c family protein
MTLLRGMCNGALIHAWGLFMMLVLATGCAPVGMEGQSVAPLVPGMTPPQGWRLAQGEALYLRHCADCHGRQGRGNGPVGRALGLQVPSLGRPELFTGRSDDALIALLAGAPLSVSLDAANLTATEEELSAIAAYLSQLPTIPWERVNNGQGLYDAFCLACHGLYARGDGQLVARLPTFPRDLSAPQYQGQISDADLLRIIAEGRGLMPGVRDLVSIDQMEAIVTYVRLLSPGHELYTRFCAACHGYEGQPVTPDLKAVSTSALPSKEMPQVAFNQAYFTTRPAAQIREGISHLLRQRRAIMPHFQRRLSENEIRQILSYLRSLQES